jgi:hypothetical protein
MSSTPLEPINSHETAAPILPEELVRNRGVIAWSSFFFALLQSICGAVVAISGLRVAIGIGAFTQSPCVKVAAKAFESPPEANRARAAGSIFGYACSHRGRRVPASQPAPLALAGHFLVEPGVQALTESDRQFEDQIVGCQDQDIASRIQHSRTDFAMIEVALHVISHLRRQRIVKIPGDAVPNMLAV